MLALKFACTSDEVLHGVDCCRGRSGGGGAWWDCASAKHGGLGMSVAQLSNRGLL